MTRPAAVPLAPAAAGLLGALLGAAAVRLGPVVLVAAGLAALALLVAGRRAAATCLLLPLCLLPHAVTAGGLRVSASDLLVAVLAAVLLAERALAPPRRALAGPLTAPAVAFVVWTLGSALWAAEPAAAAVEATQRLAFVVFGVALVAALPADGRHARRSLAGFAGGCGLLGVVAVAAGLAQGAIGVYPLGWHKNALGYLLSFGLVAALALAGPAGRSGRRWLAAASVATSAGLVFSGSRGAWVGVAAALAVAVALRRPALAWPAASVAATVVALLLLVVPPDLVAGRIDTSSTDTTAGMRLATWRTGVEAIRAEPLLGLGAGNFVSVIPNRGSQVDPNNLFLLTWAETGLPGLGLLLWLLGTCLLLAWRNARVLPPGSVAAAANLAGAGILVAAVVHAQFDMFWTRGIALATFLAAGLVVWAQLHATDARVRLPVAARLAGRSHP